MIIYFAKGGGSNPNGCATANGAYIMLSIFIGIVYAFVLLVIIIFNKGQARIDYLKLLGIAISPIIIFLLFETISNF